MFRFHWSVCLLAIAAQSGFTPAHATGVVQEWTCLAEGQYALDVPVEGESQSSLRNEMIPVRITLRASANRPGQTVEMNFGGKPYMARFGHAFIGDSGSTVAYTPQVLRAASTASPSGAKVLIVEQEGDTWRFLTTTTSLVTSHYANQIGRRLGIRLEVSPRSTSEMFTGDCTIAGQGAPDPGKRKVDADLRSKIRVGQIVYSKPKLVAERSDDAADEPRTTAGLPQTSSASVATIR